MIWKWNYSEAICQRFDQVASAIIGQSPIDPPPQRSGSQFFANVYLNELDQFVKHTLLPILLFGADAGPPVSWLAFERSHGDDEHFIWADKVNEGKLELASEDAAGAIFEWCPHFCKFCRKRFRLLDGFIKAFAETGTDRSEVRHLVKKLLPSLIYVPNGFHRW